MKLRNASKLPVFLEETAEIVGYVDKVIVGDDFKVHYVVIDIPEQVPGMVLSENFKFGEETVLIENIECIRSYLHGEELSIYEEKLGDTVYDTQGRELGKVSDFVISPHEKRVIGIEVFSGAIDDILHGRESIDLNQVCWKNIETAVVDSEGRDPYG